MKIKTIIYEPGNSSATILDNILYNPIGHICINNKEYVDWFIFDDVRKNSIKREIDLKGEGIEIYDDKSDWIKKQNE
jgi:hypothetical protein